MLEIELARDSLSSCQVLWVCLKLGVGGFDRFGAAEEVIEVEVLGK